MLGTRGPKPGLSAHQANILPSVLQSQVAFFFFNFFSFYVGICFGYVQVSVGAEGGQKRLSDPLDQEL